MKVLAFLQNQWLKDPKRHRASAARILAKYGPEVAADSRRRGIRFCLFRGCLTGRRLIASFGESVCDEIEWEEASTVITGDPKECPPADPEHIRAAIEKYRPDVVIAFGRIAADAVRHLWPGNFLIVAPHPAARDGLTPARLREAAKALELMRREIDQVKALEVSGG